jgi:hypothetical protein
MSNIGISKIVQIRVDERIFLIKKNKPNSSRDLERLSSKVFDPEEFVSHVHLWIYISTSPKIDNRVSEKFVRVFISQNNQNDLFQEEVSKGYDVIVNKEYDLFSSSSFLNLLVQKKREELHQFLSKKSALDLKKLISDTKNEIKTLDQQGLVDILFEFNKSLVWLQKDFIYIADPIKWNKSLKTFTKKHQFDVECEIQNTQDLISQDTSFDIYPLPIFNDQSFFFKIKKDARYFSPFKIYSLYHSILKALVFKTDSHDLFDDEIVWREILDLVPFPLVLLSKSGEVRQHNSLFLKLNFNPMDCLNLESKQKVIIHDVSYNTYKKEILHFDETRILVVFFTEQLFTKMNNSSLSTGQELGIISSSLAHELNNPVGGILSALSYLLLDAGDSVELRDNLNEMKESALRCKQLIETFLGFSRLNISFAPSEKDNSSEIQFCFEQAQNLLRFRIIESGVRCRFSFRKLAPFEASINKSMLTMTFYLILGEVMTLFSHQSLISQIENYEKEIVAEIEESYNHIIFFFSDLKVMNLQLSKLVQNLLYVERLGIELQDQTFKIFSV